MIALYTTLTVLGVLPIVLPAVAFLVLVVAGVGMGEGPRGKRRKSR